MKNTAKIMETILRAAGHDKVVNDFVQWLAAYRPGAERSWGYGDPRPTTTVPIDPARYADQLRALEQRAQGRGGGAGWTGVQWNFLDTPAGAASCG